MNYSKSNLVRIVNDAWLPFPLSVVPPPREPFLWEKVPEPIYDNVNALGNYLEDAVQRSIEGYDRLGLWLSGGIDSSTMLYYVSRLVDRSRIRCYTVDFGYMESDVKNAAKFTSQLGISHIIAPMKAADHIRLLRETVLNLRYPVDSWTVVPFVQRLAEVDGCDLTLSALGLDELMGGYPVHVAARNGEYAEVETKYLELCHANFAWNQVQAYPSMHLGLPFLDKTLVAYCRGLPRGFKTKKRRTKIILRSLMAGKLPEEIVSAGELVGTKGGFTPLIKMWWGNGLRQFCEESISKLPLWAQLLRLYSGNNIWRQMRLASTSTFLELLKEGAYG